MSRKKAGRRLITPEMLEVLGHLRDGQRLERLPSLSHAWLGAAGQGQAVSLADLQVLLRAQLLLAQERPDLGVIQYALTQHARNILDEKPHTGEPNG